MARSSLAKLLGQAPVRAPYRKYLVASYAENTKRAYEGDVQHFRHWGGRFPATPSEIARYLAVHAGKLAFATLSRRVAGIHREHLARGLKSPGRSELVRATLRGIARTYSRRQRQVRPLLREQLIKMLPGLRGAMGARDRAVLVLGFFGGFRRSELVGLDIPDVRLAANGVMVAVRRSKTDQEGGGRVVRLPRLRGPLCPLRALRSWLLYRPDGAPLFTSCRGDGRVLGRRITSLAIAQLIKRHVRRIGLDPAEYSGHSLRAGFVTSAARAGAATWQIKQQTGHKTDSVLAGYIRVGADAGAAVARLVGSR